jgi:protein-L-isoaspartate(D-aspartate) O-methyltransferase
MYTLNTMTEKPISDVEFISQRMRMVDTQLMPRGITDSAVLAAMRTVPRHMFVDEADLREAYADHPLPIASGQTISQPYIVASMTQEILPDRDSRVLEIGTGCGYQTAVLAEIVREVYSIEFVPELLKQANDLLFGLGYKNIHTMLGDGSLGWPQEAPFDGILVTAAAPRIPQALLDQLAEGGHMVIPLGPAHGLYQDLWLFERTTEGISRRKLYGVRFVPMRGAVEEQ